MPVPEDMRRTVRVQVRLAEKAAEVLRLIPEGLRSKWISDLIWRNRRVAQQWTSGPEPGRKVAESKGKS